MCPPTSAVRVGAAPSKGTKVNFSLCLWAMATAARCQAPAGPEWPTVTTPGFALAYSTRSFKVLNWESAFTESPAMLRLSSAMRSKSRIGQIGLARGAGRC